MDKSMLIETWLGLLSEFSLPFTHPGWRHFALCLTGGVLAERRPLLTEIVTSLGVENHWRSVEWFLEQGRWRAGRVQQRLASLAGPACRWKGRTVWAVDDTKTLKTGKKIWGTCSYHEYTSRCSNRPETVWAHNWVLCGGLSLEGGPRFLPVCGRLYMRENQMPEGEPFRTKPQLAVEMLRACAREAEGPTLAVFDGGYAVRSVLRPLLSPPEGERQIDVLTRLRTDSRLYREPAPRRPGQRGRPRKWGKRLPAPKQADRWPGAWQATEARVYGKVRRVRYKRVHAQWHPAGAEARVHAFAFEVEGYSKRWNLVTSDLQLSAGEVVQLYAARFAQEDAHRDLKQNLGFGTEQGRLKNVVLRSLQLRLTEMTLLWLLAARVQDQTDRWWPKPPWYRQKKRPSLRDVKRLLKTCQPAFSQLDWWSLNSIKWPDQLPTRPETENIAA